MYKCKTCRSCIAIAETAPFGVCTFFPSGDKNVNVLKDSCPNHSQEREEERMLEQEYFRSKAKRTKRKG